LTFEARLSTVRVAGTIIGGAVGSVVATVGSGGYSYSLETSKKRVTAASALTRERVSGDRSRAPMETDRPRRPPREQLPGAD